MMTRDSARLGSERCLSTTTASGRTLTVAGVLFLAVSTCVPTTLGLRPLLVWHGINDNCQGFAADVIADIKLAVPNLYVHCIKTSISPRDDKIESFIVPANIQLRNVCKQLANDTRLHDGFNAFGISQGGLLLRALIQTCPPGPVHNFVTLAAPHQGVFGIPECGTRIPEFMCKIGTAIVNQVAYSHFGQPLATPLGYWHDPARENTYRLRSSFLALQNNERDYRESVKQNFLKLNKLVLVLNRDDEVLTPPATAHFGFFHEGQGQGVVNFSSTRLYEEDLIGLKTLVEQHKVRFEIVPGRHTNYDKLWLQNLVRTYFSE